MSEQCDTFQTLDNKFYQQPTLELAVSLLGCILVKETEEGTASGIIVETEAYVGPMDKAAHSYNNRRTKRTEIMFHEAGLAYTYVMHTHTLFNVVSGEEGNPEAVLIRAIQPVEGIDLMVKRRGMPDSANLTNGPGKLTKAMGINTSDYGHPLTEKPLFISQGFVPESISSGKRIGIDNSGEARDYPWRFWITGNRYVSRHQNAEKIIVLKDVSTNGGT
ncbi:DNA-3-methyladenine glycosylase [Mesobacillus selenatarsenatis]|uniref:Putative 3-methyladenine DNA glycosylase n=1 Tax=Mesobacillus selenatarsenatis (strain DSM 18680 / JCM 14380 / FERM P-15431 / SF-1) TaxID=1321606 RepID=A0A0A8XBX4_MESS1|nr:DNA-3-methyladenine glycosylase [Mesobacillus selenatarsenatis]GAM16527.1 DNA-3-methyladenine glycosylase II [Mesobacillus selenatarsenatis SF-1]